MKPFKEELITHMDPFPVDVFIQDNRKMHVLVLPHWHDCIEMLYLIEGSARQHINEKCFDVKKHDLIIIDEGDIHYTTCTPGEDVRILVVKFLPEVVESNCYRAFESKYIFPFLNDKRKKNCYSVDTLISSEEIDDLLMRLYEEFIKRTQGYEIFIKGAIYQLIAYLVRNNILNINQSIGREKELLRLDKLLKYIENHYMDDIDLKKAADMQNLSYYYFSRYFKKITGRTFKEYINFVRIREAERLIMSGETNMSQVAYDVGFGSISSFYRTYKKIRGYSPGYIKKTITAKK